MTASSLLRSARKLISNRGAWLSNERDMRGKMATDAIGNEVRYDDPAARKFSLDGALLRCADLSSKEGQGDYHEAVRHLKGMFRGSLAEFNDRSSHGKVLEYLDRAANALGVIERIAA